MKEIIRLFGSEIYFTITELHEGRKFDFFPSVTEHEDQEALYLSHNDYFNPLEGGHMCR